jgi:PAS domain S-box-containing protein
MKKTDLHTQLKKSVEESEALYKTLVNSIPNPILIHANGKVIFANDIIIEVTGHNKDEIVGKALSDILVDPSDHKRHGAFQNLLQGNILDEEEIELRTENQKVILKSFLLRNIRIRYRGQEAIMSILMDITERKHLEKYILSKVIETEEKDRKQFAADLHDDLGPTLSSIKLHLGLLEHAKDPGKFSETLKICNDQLTEAITKMRIISNNLMPRLIENYGLEAAVNSFINTMQSEEVFAIDFTSNLKGRRFPRQIELHFYRIICELINNTVKHAGASLATIKLKLSKETLTLLYTDNGKGYEVGALDKRKAGMGIGNILQRVNLIDGNIEFAKKKRKTEVRITKLI